jgi:hypothetical protein
MAKKGLQAKIVKHAQRRRFQDYVRTKGRDKATIGYVYWSMFLRSGKGNVFELAEELFLADLGIGKNSFRSARKTLVDDGWMSKGEQKMNPVTGLWGTVEYTVYEEPAAHSVSDGTVAPLTGDRSTADGSAGDRSVGDTVVLHSLYADASTSFSSPSASTPSEERMKEGTATPSVTPSAEEEPRPSLKPENPETNEVHRVWFSHTETPFSQKDFEAAGKLLKIYELLPLLNYIIDTFNCPRTTKVAWRDFSYWAENFDLTRRNIDAWRRTTKVKKAAAATGHAARNPELHTGKSMDGKSWTHDALRFCPHCDNLHRADQPCAVTKEEAAKIERHMPEPAGQGFDIEEA